MGDVQRSYHLEQAVTGEINHPVFGRIPFAFDAGTVSARSEQDELALEHLHQAGLATAEGGPVPIRSSTLVATERGLERLDELKLAELRKLARDAGIDTDGLRRADLIAELERLAPSQPDVVASQDASGAPDGDASGSDFPPETGGDPVTPEV